MTKLRIVRNGVLLAAFAAPGLIWSHGAFAQAPAASAPPAAVAPAAPRIPKATNDRVEQRIRDLHTELHITPAIESQWNQFAQVMRDNATDMSQSFDQRGARLTSMNASENMQSYAMLASQHAQDMQKLATAFQTLYASMSDDQKKAADIVFRPRADRHQHS